MDLFAVPGPSHISVTELLILGLARNNLRVTYAAQIFSEKRSGPCRPLVTSAASITVLGNLPGFLLPLCRYAQVY